jgi:hypothetical protein
VSFIHVIEHDAQEPDTLQDVPAFQALLAEIAERCDTPYTMLAGISSDTDIRAHHHHHDTSPGCTNNSSFRVGRGLGAARGLQQG